MKIITGGRYNGKLEYAVGKLGFSVSEVLDLEKTDINQAVSVINEYPVLYHLEAFIKNSISEGIDFNSVIDGYTASHRDGVIICDEIGSGVVPAEREDDEWREAVGRTMCRLAKASGGIIRITCGIPEELGYAL